MYLLNCFVHPGYDSLIDLSFLDITFAFGRFVVCGLGIGVALRDVNPKRRAFATAKTKHCQGALKTAFRKKD